MDLLSNPNNLLLLQELLNPENGDSDSEEIKVQPKLTEDTKDAFNSAPNSALVSAQTAEPKSYEEWEHQEALVNGEYFENRLRPSYDIVYKQAVCTEDIFLQLGNKTTATASCEQMTIKISMPEETVDINHMQLDLTADSVDLQTPKYRLKLPLVQKVNPDKGKATWDAENKVLLLVLLMERDFDFVNF